MFNLKFHSKQNISKREEGGEGERLYNECLEVAMT